MLDSVSLHKPGCACPRQSFLVPKLTTYIALGDINAIRNVDGNTAVAHKYCTVCKIWLHKQKYLPGSVGICDSEISDFHLISQNSSHSGPITKNKILMNNKKSTTPWKVGGGGENQHNCCKDLMELIGEP